MKTRLIIASANMFVQNKQPVEGLKNLQRIARKEYGYSIDVAGLQEARTVPEGRIDRLFVRKVAGKAHPERWATLNPHAVKPWFKIIGHDWHVGAKGDPDSYGMPPRNFTVLRYRKRGRKFANVNTHMHVLGDPVAGKTLKAREYVGHVDYMMETIDALRRLGYIVTVTADHNCPDTDWPESLVRRLRDEGFTVFATNRDLVAVDRKHLRFDRAIIVPQEQTHADHDAIVVRAYTR